MIDTYVSFYEQYGLQRTQKVISKEEEYALIARLQANPHDIDAQECLLKAHVRFISHKAHIIARKMLYESVVIEVDDLIQVGCASLLESIPSFDVNRDTRLLTIAGYRIWRDMLNYVLDNDSLIDIPRHLQTALYSASQKHNNDSPEASRKEENEFFQAAQRAKQPVLSLNKKFKEAPNDDEGKTLSDILPDTSDSPLERAEHIAIREMLYALFETLLDEQEQRIIILLYGFNEAIGKCTLEEVARLEHSTRERVRVIDERVRRRLARSQDMQALYDAL